MKLTLTKPNAKKSNDKPTIDDRVELVDRIRQRQDELDSLTAEQKTEKAELLAYVRELGHTSGTIQVTATGDPVEVIYQDRFNKIGVEFRDHLQEGLNGQYSQLLQDGLTLKPKAGTTFDALQELLGDKWAQFLTMVDVVEHIEVKKGFRANRELVRPLVDDGTNETLDSILESCAQAPQVRVHPPRRKSK